MHPLRHSASFPSLASSANSHSTSSISPLPPLPADRSGDTQFAASVLSASRFASRSSALFPASSTLSHQYNFPSQPFTPPPAFGLLLPQLYRCCTFSSAHHSYLASLRLRCCLYVSHDALPPAVLLFFQQHRIHVQLLLCPPPLHSALPAPSAAFPHPLSIACCPTAGQYSPLSSSSLPVLLKPALEYLLSSSSHPLLLMSSSPLQPLLPQLVAVLRSLLGWPLSCIVEEWSRFAPNIGIQAISDTEGWLAEDELWLPDDDKVGWWADEEDRKRRVREQQSSKEVGEEEVEAVLERLFGAAYRDQRLISDRVVFDEHLSIVEDDDD